MVADKTLKRGYICFFGTWFAILSLISCRPLNSAQDFIHPWLLSISEGRIISLGIQRVEIILYVGLWLQFLEDIKKTNSSVTKVQSKALFLLPELPLYSHWVVLHSCCVVLYSCCLMLCRVVLVLLLV